MYAYVFDSFVQDQRHRNDVARIETKISALGIQGRTEKITILKNIQDAVREMIKRGADTVVAVGNDETVLKILPIVVDADVTLGIIPVGGPQRISGYFGIPSGQPACETISRRILQRIDIGQANERYFLLNAALPAGASVKCDAAYTVQSNHPQAAMEITNVAPDGFAADPADSQLELLVHEPERGGWRPRRGAGASVFRVRVAQVEGGKDPLVLDGRQQVALPAEIKVAKRQLRVIVSRDRAF